MRRSDHFFKGWLRSTYDALLVFEAARRGIVPRVTRRFHDIEKRNEIQSGSVFVFTEEESGIKRWTDPFLWSASRMLGNFLVRHVLVERLFPMFI
jgi:Gti1/Pac2 family transcription factor